MCIKNGFWQMLLKICKWSHKLGEIQDLCSGSCIASRRILQILIYIKGLVCSTQAPYKQNWLCLNALLGHLLQRTKTTKYTQLCTTQHKLYSLLLRKNNVGFVVTSWLTVANESHYFAHCFLLHLISVHQQQ